MPHPERACLGKFAGRCTSRSNLKVGCSGCNLAGDAPALSVTSWSVSKIKARLGGRVNLILSGGAPLAGHVEEYLEGRVRAFQPCSMLTPGRVAGHTVAGHMAMKERAVKPLEVSRWLIAPVSRVQRGKLPVVWKRCMLLQAAWRASVCASITATLVCMPGNAGVGSSLHGGLEYRA